VVDVRRLGAAAIALVMAAACKGGDAPPSPGGGSGSAVRKPAPAPRHDFVALTGATTRPALIGPFVHLNLSPSLTIGAAKRDAPALFVTVMKALDWFQVRADEFPGVELRVQRRGQIDRDPDEWTVGILRVVLPAAGLRERLTRAWGPPRTAGSAAYWFDPAVGLRARLTEPRDADVPPGTAYLDYAGYTPLAQLLGETGDRFGFEGAQPLIGAHPADLERRFPHLVFDEGDRLRLWPTELGDDDTKVELGSFGDVPDPIAGFRIELPRAQLDEARLLLAKKLGAPTEDAEGDLIYRKQPRVALRGSTLEVGTPPD
jgi:hypothetical protein